MLSIQSQEFNKNNRSSFNIEQILLFTVILGGSFAFLWLHIYIVAVILFVGFALSVNNYSQIPKKVVIDQQGIQFSKTILWDVIEKVEFTCSSGQDYRDTQVVIYERTGKHIIHTALFENRKDLRDLIETVCVEKGIKYFVTDRGLYK